MFIDPADAIVRRVRLRYRNKFYAGNKAYVGTLSAVEFLDDDGKSVLKAGHCDTENSQYTYHDVRIDKDERMVGVKASRRGEAFLWDVQFMFAKIN